MKKRLVFIGFACILALFALTACDENQQVIGILKDASELSFLHVAAYADEFQLQGGATLEPSLRADVFHYTVFVAKDANFISIDAGLEGDGTVEIYSVEDQTNGTMFNYTGDGHKVILITAQREYMEEAEYTLTVVRANIVPVAENIKVTSVPAIGTFFIGSGVLPEIKVTANLPTAGGVLSYQWYMNTVGISVGGYPISGETGDTYKMRRGETMTIRTVYYYVEITNTLDGQTGVTVSPPCAVTFVNKYEMDVKSLAMMDIPAGNVASSEWTDWRVGAFSTPGYKMGKYQVTWELWKKVFDYADSGGYRFAHEGNQGADGDTYIYTKPVGNKLHPVTCIAWRDAVVWCNAYSEMDGLEPVYRDSSGNVLRNSREAVEMLIDNNAVENNTYNGYRLPSGTEWMYAAQGAYPAGSMWSYKFPGWDNIPNMQEYLYSWGAYSEKIGAADRYETGEVGRLLPNKIWDGVKYVDGLYDMMGMVYEWIWRPESNGEGQDDGLSFFNGADTESQCNFISSYASTCSLDNLQDHWEFIGLRLVRNKD